MGSVGRVRDCTGSGPLIPGLLEKGCIERDVNAKMDLGSVNAPPPLEHRDSGVGWSLQAASNKRQAPSC